MSNLKLSMVHERIWTFPIIKVIDSQGYDIICSMRGSLFNRNLIHFVANLIMANGVTNDIKLEVEFMLDVGYLSSLKRLEVTSRILEEL